jgi:hypothetical protein
MESSKECLHSSGIGLRLFPLLADRRHKLVLLHGFLKERGCACLNGAGYGHTRGRSGNNSDWDATQRRMRFQSLQDQ